MEKSRLVSEVVDPIDKFTSEILSNPGMAHELKKSFRQKMGLADYPKRGAASVEAADNDADDLWDNLPI